MHALMFSTTVQAGKQRPAAETDPQKQLAFQ
jgi:hypothetical protein